MDSKDRKKFRVDRRDEVSRARLQKYSLMNFTIQIIPMGQ